MCLWDTALCDSGLALVRSMCGIELDMLRGAFDKELNYAKLYPCGNEFFSTAGHKNAIFCLLENDLAFELKFRQNDFVGDAW